MKTNFLSGCLLHRASIRRKDAAWVRSHFEAAEATAVVLCGSQAWVSGSPLGVCYATIAELIDLGVAQTDFLFLGLDGERGVFCVDVSDEIRKRLESSADGREFKELRRLGPALERPDGALLAYAKSLNYWNQSHRFCSTCGATADCLHGGHLRLCSDASCGRQHFPRTDPAIITLVTHRDRCLLVREATWEPRRYATVAGFLDPGESLEEAVIREVREETGLRVSRVQYHSSQPWPFPGTVMIGFNAEADSDDESIDTRELEDGRWFTREGLRGEVLAGNVLMPARISISNRLVVDWFLENPPVGSEGMFRV